MSYIIDEEDQGIYSISLRVQSLQNLHEALIRQEQIAWLLLSGQTGTRCWQPCLWIRSSPVCACTRLALLCLTRGSVLWWKGRAVFFPHDPFIACPPLSSSFSLSIPYSQRAEAWKKVGKLPRVTPVFICLMVEHCEQSKSCMESTFLLILFLFTLKHLKKAVLTKFHKEDPIAHKYYVNNFLIFCCCQFHKVDVREIVWHLGKCFYWLSCREPDEKRSHICPVKIQLQPTAV